MSARNSFYNLLVLEVILGVMYSSNLLLLECEIIPLTAIHDN